MSDDMTTVLVKKRERTQNWVPEEKSVLLALIKGHVNAIENKRVDAAASAMKTLAWQQIHRTFRSRFSTDRDIIRMREQWRRMKAQARIEMCTFIEKLKSTGPEEAAKSRPSNLSIEVWRLIENGRKADGQTECSDDNSRHIHENSMNLQKILDKLLTSAPEVPTPEIKIEANSDISDVDDEDVSRSDLLIERSQTPQKKMRMSYSDKESTDPVDEKVYDFSRIIRRSNAAIETGFSNRNSTSPLDKGNEILHVQEESVEKNSWVQDATQREQEFKLRMLQIELDRVELQRQTALNELKAAEVKRQLIESQAMDYYSQVRMISERGSGAGKGGGGGGSIREAGGSFGKMEVANEDQYFYNQQKEQLQKLREGLHDEISFHEEQIKRHQEAINRHKKRITDMEKE